MDVIKLFPLKYENIELIKESSKSLIYKAYNKASNEDIVIKFIPIESSFFKGVFDEFKNLFKFKHPNLIEVREYNYIASAGIYYTMPFLQKTDPSDYCKRNKTEGFLNIFFQLLCGLHFLHQRYISHGDLTPDNLIFCEENNNLKVYLTDFGLSSLIAADNIVDISGTAKYIAPELVSKSGNAAITPQADLYSLGVILYEIVTGNPPFSHTDVIKLMKDHIKKDIPKIVPLFPIEEEIIKVILKLLQKDPEGRFQDCKQILFKLLPLLKKYGLKQSLLWKDVLYEMIKKDKINVNYCREKIIQNALCKITSEFSAQSDKSIFCISGEGHQLSGTTFEYLKYELINENFKVVPVTLFDNFTDNDIKVIIESEIPKTDNISSTLKELMHTTVYKKIILSVSDPSAFMMYGNTLPEIVRRYENLYLLVVINSKYSENPIGDDILTYQIAEFSKTEITELIELKFGYNVIPEKIKKSLIKNCGNNAEYLNSYIESYMDSEVMSYRNLQWFFDEKKFNPNSIPPQIEIEIQKQLTNLSAEYNEITKLIALWKDRFTLKEISDISGLSLVKTDDILNILKKQKVLIQPSKSYSFRYPAMKHIINSQLYDIVTSLQKKVVKYAVGLHDPDLEARAILFTLSKELSLPKVMLKTAFELFDSYTDMNALSKDFDVLMPIGEEIWLQRNVLKSTNICQLVKVLLSYSNTIIMKGQYSRSREMFDEIYGLSKLCDERNVAEITFLRRMYFLYNDADYEKMNDLYEEEKQFVSKMSELRQARLQLNIADSYQRREMFEKSENYFKSIISICDKNKDVNNFEKIRLRCLERLGFQKTEYDKENAYEYYAKALSVAEKLKLTDQIAVLNSRLAWTAKQNYKYDVTLKHLEKASSAIKRSKITFPRSIISNTYGAYYFATDDYWKSLLNYHKSYSECLKYDQDFVTPVGNKGNMFLQLGYYKQAIKFCEIALNVLRKKKKHYFSDLLLTTMAESYAALGEYEKSEECLNEIEVSENNKTNKFFSFNLHLYKVNNFVKKRQFSKARDELEIIDNSKSASDTLTYLAKANMLKAEKLFKKANIAIDKALHLYEKSGALGEKAQQLLLDAYTIKKETFEQNISTENYKKYIQRAYDLIISRAEKLPTEVMKKHYLTKKNNTAVMNLYRQEFKGNVLKTSNIDLLEIIEEMTEIISKVNNRTKLFTKILELAAKVTKAGRGLILIINPETKIPEVEFSYKIKDDSISDATTLSKELINEVIKKKKPIFKTDITAKKNYNSFQSFVNLNIRSAVCLPLIIHNQVIGAVYSDSSGLLAFSPEEIQFLNIFSRLAASAIETSENYNKLQIEKERLTDYIKSQSNLKHPSIIAKSGIMEELFRKIDQISPTDVNVLIEGDSGTGKELVAKEIHRLSRREKQAFIPIDCGSLSEDIIESELFGHKKGAFTGAISDKEGIFELADNGTIFLDEISNISLSTQAKLLRVIQEGEVKRMGETFVRNVNVRTLVASNIPLHKLVAEGKFRQDLYYRLSIFPITVPLLRERGNDVVILAQHFLDYFAALHNKSVSALSESALQKLISYNWPGNVRQLQNEIERAVIIYSDIGERLPGNLFDRLSAAKSGISTDTENINLNDIENFTEIVDQYKLKVIKTALEKNENNMTKAAKKLGLSRQNLSQIYKRIKK